MIWPLPRNAIFRSLVSRCGDERGFALLEILIAFIVLAVGLGIILSGITAAVHADVHTKNNLAVLRVVQSRLEATGIAEELVIGRRQGVMADRYTWQQTVTPVQTSVAGLERRGPAPDQAAVNPDLAPLWVEITVRAKDGTMATLSALKIKSKSNK